MNVTLPEWYDDLAEIECESKGSALNFNVTIKSREIVFNFYDITRFNQDAEIDIEDRGYFRDENIVILKEVTIENIVKFLDKLNKMKINPDARI